MSALLFSVYVVLETHLFDSILHHIADDSDLFLLPEANGAADGLRLDGWVPLGLNNMYSGRDSKVKTYLSVNNPASKTS